MFELRLIALWQIYNVMRANTILIEFENFTFFR